MIALPYLSVIQFSGNDAGVFLHNQLSADVLALNDGGTTFACYCEPKGRVLALMLVGKVKNDFYVILSASLAATITARLKIYVMRSQVGISELQDHIVTGLQSADLPGHAAGSMISLPVPGSEKLLGVCSTDDTPDNHQALVDEWKVSELQRGISWLEPESSGQFLPQMLGFDQLGAVNFRKGCYPGQEIVARTHYLGKVKRFPRVLNTREHIGARPLEKIQLHSGDQSFEAVVADTCLGDNGGDCIFVVTRMDPELPVDRAELDGKVSETYPVP